MPRRENHEVHKDIWGHWGKKISVETTRPFFITRRNMPLPLLTSFSNYELHAVSIWFVNRASPYRKMLLRHAPSEQIRIQKSFYWEHGGSFNGTIDGEQQQLSVNSLPSIKVTSTLNTPLQVDLQHWASDPQLSSTSMQHHYKHRWLSFHVPQYFK